MWYDYQDMHHMKKKAMAISHEARRYGLGSLLTDTYGRSCPETQASLNTWALRSSSRRGLERWINDEYAAKRADIRRRTTMSVLRAQEKLREAEILDPDYAGKILARLSEAFSKDSLTFARMMGTADAMQEEEEMSLKSLSLHSTTKRKKSILPRRSDHLSVSSTDLRHFV